MAILKKKFPKFRKAQNMNSCHGLEFYTYLAGIILSLQRLSRLIFIK